MSANPKWISPSCGMQYSWSSCLWKHTLSLPSINDINIKRRISSTGELSNRDIGRSVSLMCGLIVAGSSAHLCARRAGTLRF